MFSHRMLSWIKTVPKADPEIRISGQEVLHGRWIYGKHQERRWEIRWTGKEGHAGCIHRHYSCGQLGTQSSWGLMGRCLRGDPSQEWGSWIFIHQLSSIINESCFWDHYLPGNSSLPYRIFREWGQAESRKCVQYNRALRLSCMETVSANSR